MHEPSKKILSSILLALTVFLVNVLLYDYDVCSPINQVYPQDITCIELVIQLEKPDIPQIHDDSPFTNLGEESSSFISKHAFHNEIDLFRFSGSSETNDIINRHLDFPANHIISILQKKNHWHQSSDDEPSPHIYS
jgi:hypothetical protein